MPRDEIENGAIARHMDAKGNTRWVRVEGHKHQLLVHGIDPATRIKKGTSRWVLRESVVQKKRARLYAKGTILAIIQDGDDLIVHTTKGIKKLPMSALEDL